MKRPYQIVFDAKVGESKAELGHRHGGVWCFVAELWEEKVVNI